jgi:hypothetical protein
MAYLITAAPRWTEYLISVPMVVEYEPLGPIVGNGLSASLKPYPDTNQRNTVVRFDRLVTTRGPLRLPPSQEVSQ